VAAVRKNTPTIIVATGAILREGIASTLRNTSYKLVASAAGPKELTHVRYAERQATLAIVGTDGRDTKLNEIAESIRLLRSLMPDGKVVLIVEADRTIDLPRVLALSPDACIVNLGSGDTLLRVLELVFMGQQVFAIARSIAKVVIESAVRTTINNNRNGTERVVSELHSNGSLSPRERQILISLAEGKSNKLIARQYSLSEATVKVHLKAILRKTGKHNRTEAAIWAVEHGLSDHLSEHRSIVSDALSLVPASQPAIRNRTT
jgi:two-component system nitrate/nitrite response regulator NarL